MSATTQRFVRRFNQLAERNFVVGVSFDAVNAFNRHEAMARAAAIAYYSILSLFPFALLAIVVASFFLGTEQQLDAFVTRVAAALGIDPAALQAGVESILDARALLAVVGIALLLVAIVPWVSAVQRGIVRAFEEERRSYVRTTIGSLALLSAAAVLILLSGVWASLLSLLIGLVDRFFGDITFIDATLTVLVNLLPVLVVFAMMTALLRAIPASNPTFRDVGLGALVTAVGFLVLRLGFDLYVSLFVANSGSSAGPFGAVLVGLLYIDFLAIAMLAGAEVAAAVHRRRRRGAPAEPPR